MTTMYNVGDTVLIKAKVVSTSIDKHGIRYSLEHDQVNGYLNIPEEDIPFKLNSNGMPVDVQIIDAITVAEVVNEKNT